MTLISLLGFIFPDFIAHFKLGKALIMQEVYFSTVIKSKTGKSINNWIAEKVIAEAQAILSRSPTSIQEVASQLGFKEPGHFSRYFKKYTRMSPSAFRDQVREN